MKEDKILLFDGAMGTMLQRRGLKLREVPESLSVNQPELIESIHREYLEAGSSRILTNTFGVSPFKLEGTGYTTEQVVRAGIAAANRAAADFPGAGVVLDIGPSGRAMAPVGDTTFDQIYESVARQVCAADSGCCAVLLETFTDLLELKASVLAVLENCSLPVYATMSFQENGRTFFGTSVESMIMTLEGLGVSALGVNCSLGPIQIAPIVEKLLRHSRVPVMVQPNAGLPVVRNGVASWDVTPEEFAGWIKKFADGGAAIVGGCCGTDPEFIRRTSEALGDRRLKERTPQPLTGVCSASRRESFDETVIIGERLNPTGKKKLQAALRSCDLDYVISEAQTQKEQGASVLDVNAGLPDIDEAAVLRGVVLELQGALDLPLQVDSSKPEALEAAVRVYAGKPLINSVSGKASSLSSVLPVVKKYGACVLGLTLDDSGIPQTAEERFAVAEKIVAEAVRLGIPKEDIFIDCLTLTASAQQSLVFETLKAVRMVKERLGVKTVLGVSNVSFGLPRRPLINRTMLALALANGLDAAIMNPGDMGMQDTLAAWRVLSAQDKDSACYISWCADHPAETVSAPAAAKEGATVSGGSELARAIACGMKDEAHRCAAELLKTCAPLEIVEKQLIPPLDAVGRDYETGRIYLPQLIKSADAAKGAFDAVKEALASQEGTSEAVDTVVLATVYGDVHDIGKNVVKVIMQNYNFSVIDLGKDVAPETVAAAVKKSGVKTVGLSALMTTTVASMKDTIALLRAECPGTRVIVGGAVLTEELAQYVGADAYARDAMATVRAAEQFAAERKQNS